MVNELLRIPAQDLRRSTDAALVAPRVAWRGVSFTAARQPGRRPRPSGSGRAERTGCSTGRTGRRMASNVIPPSAALFTPEDVVAFCRVAAGWVQGGLCGAVLRARVGDADIL